MRKQALMNNPTSERERQLVLIEILGIFEQAEL